MNKQDPDQQTKFNEYYNDMELSTESTHHKKSSAFLNKDQLGDINDPIVNNILRFCSHNKLLRKGAGKFNYYSLIDCLLYVFNSNETLIKKF